LADADAVLPPGKLPGDLLARLIGRYVRRDPSVLIGPGVGRDAAAIRVGDRVLVVKTDPITFATADIGRYLVHVNANDIACMGATPRWLLVTALLPETSTTARLAEDIFASLAAAADQLGILLVGGHSEITVGIDRPILVGQLLGDAAPDELLDVATARPGDAVLLCSGIAIEGTAILAREARDRITSLPADALDRAANLLQDPGLSILPAASALQASGATIRGLHDPTEGGLMTALAELCQATGLGIIVDAAAIHVLPETQAVCAALGLDPFGLISSGALLAVVAPADVDLAVGAVTGAGIACERIGSLLADPSMRILRREGAEVPLPAFAVDEIARFFASQLSA
jgi:hydrogenase maturation factor